MDTTTQLSASLANANYVQEITHVIAPFARSPQTQTMASELYGSLIETDLHRLRGSPDEWFNFAASAAMARNYTAAEKILTVAIELHPEDVDLRCEWFQFAYGHVGMEEAIAARERLEDLGADRTATFWRYWCYNAIFESQHLGNKEAAARLLDEALSVVPPAGLLNIYRNYRLVLIDGSARPSLSSEESMTDHAAIVARIEEKYREGLRLGIEAGYVLAVDLARLLRERTSGMQMSEADKVLDEALQLLDVAERTYTDDGNHPLWDIYREKATMLMARRRYEDALQIFRSLPEYRLNDSMTVMAQYAANMTGQEFKPAGQQPVSPAGSDLEERVTYLERVMNQLLSVLRSHEEGSPPDAR